MLLIKTKLGKSKIHGIGLFTEEFIHKGKVVQKFLDGFDLSISEKELKKLPPASREQVLKYAYKHKLSGKYILCSDDARFLNHSNSPNLIGDDQESDIAAHNIQKGEELTVDYRDFDKDYDYKMSLSN